VQSSFPPCVLEAVNFFFQKVSFSRSPWRRAHPASLSPEMTFLTPEIERSPSFLVSLVSTIDPVSFPSALRACESMPRTLKTSGNLVVYGNTTCHTEVVINPHPFSSSSISWSPKSRNIWSGTLELQVILSKHFPACLTLDSLSWPRKQRVFQMILFSLCD